MRNFLIAIQFLTKLPVRLKKEVKPAELGKSMAYFPLVGACLGLFLWAVYVLSSTFLPGLASIVIVVAASVFITGGFHLDGFSDTVDGLSGGKDKQQILKIMSDEKTGALGVAAIVLLLFMKVSILYSMPNYLIFSSLILMGSLGRWSMVFSARVYPPAKTEGLGNKFIKNLNNRAVVWASIIMLVLLFTLARARAALILSLAIIAVAGFNYWMLKRIDGLTGDTLGAINELVEVVTLLVIAS